MKLADLRRRRDLLCAALAAAAGAVLVLAGALVWCALRPRPVLVVPGAAAPQERLPGEVPDAAALAFSIIYIYEFDNYTPGTIEGATAALKARIAARTWSQASEGLDRRIQVIQEGRIASHMVAAPGGRVDRATEGVLAVTIDGIRRVFIADKLSREERVRYRLELETCPVTAGNPHGLSVVSQLVEEVKDEDRH